MGKEAEAIASVITLGSGRNAAGFMGLFLSGMALVHAIWGRKRLK